MGIDIIENEENGYKAMYCNTTMWAFGGVFYEDEEPQEFLDWLPQDARRYEDNELESLMSKWRATKTS